MDRLEERVASKCLSLGKTVAVAESCTGGLVAHLLTRQPGASGYFVGGIVCYANRVKIELLGVDPHVLEREGAVSEAVARQMALGALQRFHSDYALAITGIAGPTGGSVEKPIGTAWLALATKEAPIQTWKIHAPPQAPSQERITMIHYFADQLLSHFMIMVHGL